MTDTMMVSVDVEQEATQGLSIANGNSIVQIHVP